MYPTKKLSEIVTTIRGITYKPEQLKPKEEGIACFRTKNIQEFLDENDIYYIDPSILRNNDKILETGDILISSANSLEQLGKCCLIENLSYKATLGGFICAMRPNQSILNYKYFYLFFNSEKLQRKIRTFSKKTTGIANLQLKDVENLEIPLPPLATQSRIVARLDSAFASIDEQILLLRANIADMENMRKSVLEESFQSGEYEEVYLGNKEFIEIIDGDRGANYPKKTEFTESGFCLFLNTSNVRQGFFDFSKMDFITEEKYNKMGKGKVYKNDVILTTRGTIGNSAFVEDNFPYDYIRINSGMVILRNNLQKVSPKYIIHFINSPLFESQKQTFVSGSAQPQLPITVIKQIYIPLPPLPRQHEIIAHLDRVFAETDALRREYEAQIRDLQTLKQSLLEEAFAGRLVQENEV